MRSLKKKLKFSFLPKKLYLCGSALKKYRRSRKKGEAELQLLPFLVDKNKASIDIGANNGLYTYFLSKLSTHVYAFEPHKQLANFLDKATGDTVTVTNCALSDKAGEETFYIPMVKGQKSLNVASLDKETTDHCHKDVVEEVVKVVPLDSYNLENIGFIKIDVEGHELAVMKGAVETLARCKPIILMEILTDGKNVTETAIVHFLRDQGYDMLYMQDNVLQAMPAQGVSHKGRNYIFLPRG